MRDGQLVRKVNFWFGQQETSISRQRQGAEKRFGEQIRFWHVGFQMECMSLRFRREILGRDQNGEVSSI
jgi:hypothetical protein